MRKLQAFTIAGVICSVIISACGNASPTPSNVLLARPSPPPDYVGKENPIADRIPAIKIGKEKYSIHCVMCHGESGMGDGPVAASLNPKPQSFVGNREALSDAYLFWRINEGGVKQPFNSAMPAWKNILKEDEIWSIITYLRTIMG